MSTANSPSFLKTAMKSKLAWAVCAGLFIGGATFGRWWQNNEDGADIKAAQHSVEDANKTIATTEGQLAVANKQLVDLQGQIIALNKQSIEATNLLKSVQTRHTAADCKSLKDMQDAAQKRYDNGPSVIVTIDETKTEANKQQSDASESLLKQLEKARDDYAKCLTST